jgi:Mrp family chromosome partitioning ATPase/capsular polysaccharide biosynthesis protein
VEPIDYKRAITRRWPLILACAVVGAIVAVLIPVHVSPTASETMWQAQALTGVQPSRSSSTNSLGADDAQIEFFAEQTPVYAATAKALKLKLAIVKLRNAVTLKSVKSKKKKVPPGSFYIQVEQTTKAGAANMANTFAKQLIIYSNAQLATEHTLAIKQTGDEITSLTAQLSVVDAQIAALTKKAAPPKPKTPPTTTTTKPPAPTTTTTSTTTTTTTDAPHSHVVPNVSGDDLSDACTAIGAQGLSCSPSSQYVYDSSQTVPVNHVITTDPPPGSVIPAGSLVKLVVSSGPSTTTTAVTTATQSVAQSHEVATLLASSVDFVQDKHKSGTSTTTSSTSPTSTTASSAGKDQLGPLQTKQKALSAALGAAIQHLQSLQNGGVPTSGLTLLVPARASQAKAIPGTSNPFAHRLVRGAVGVVGGALIGVAIALLLDALDKRLRRADRAAQVFGLPVLAEVPKCRPRLREPGPPARSGRKKKGQVVAPQPVAAQAPFIVVTDEPTSLAAEAYRRLRVAVMFASTEGREGDSADTGAFTASGSDPSTVSGMAPQRTNGSADALPTRQVVLVVSPTLEPTAPDVVANLAAAYAEAGQTSLVVTTNDLRSKTAGYSSWANNPEPPTIQTRVAASANSPAVANPGEPTQQLPATAPPSVPVAPSAPRDPRVRSPFSVEEVAAHCRPQQIHGVLRLELGELLRGPGEMATRGNEVLAAARQIADVVLVETPSLLATPDAEAVSRSVDAIVVVAECYYTTVSQATRSAGLLRRIGTPVLGIVLTAVELNRKELKKMSSSPPRPDLRDSTIYAVPTGS